jgi:hypothetical protein
MAEKGKKLNQDLNARPLYQGICRDLAMTLVVLAGVLKWRSCNSLGDNATKHQREGDEDKELSTSKLW